MALRKKVVALAQLARARMVAIELGRPRVGSLDDKSSRVMGSAGLVFAPIGSTGGSLSGMS